MYGLGGKQFVSANIRTWGKPKGPDIKCFVIDLDFSFNNSDKTTGVGNNCGIVSQLGYIWIWSGAHDQESTNHRACFVEWKDGCITSRNTTPDKLNFKTNLVKIIFTCIYFVAYWLLQVTLFCLYHRGTCSPLKRREVLKQYLFSGITWKCKVTLGKQHACKKTTSSLGFLLL